MRQIHKNFWVMLFIIICLAVGVLGCATPAAPQESTSTPAIQTKTLSIGAVTALTGPAATWGREWQRAHELGADEINARGGLKVGDDRYLVKIIAYDHKYVGTEAVAATNKLIFQDGVKYISLWGSAPCLAALPITTEQKVLTILSGFAEGIISPAHPYAFRTQYTPVEAGEGMYGYVTSNMKQIKTVAMIGPDDDTGKTNLKQSKNLATSMGLNVVAEQYIPRGTTDFYPVISNIMAKNPDMIDTDAIPPADLALFTKQSREKGYKGTIIQIASLDVPTLLDVAGKDAAEGLLSVDINFEGPSATSVQKEFVKRYLDKYGPPFGALCAQYYINIMTYAAGIENAQSIDPVTISNTLPDISFEVLGDKLTWGGVQRYGIKHQIAQPIYISEIHNGQLNTLGKYTPVVP